jgi:hypothetical membrane protein
VNLPRRNPNYLRTRMHAEFRLLRYFRSFRQWLENLNAFTKWMLVVGAKSAVVSLVLGALAPYATAFYAIRNGFRVPIEGVPYIHFAIAIWSFLSFFIAIGMFTILMTALQQILLLDAIGDRLIKPTRRMLEIRARSRSLKVTLAIVSLLLVSLIGIYLTDWQYHKTFSLLGNNVSARGLVNATLFSALVVVPSFYFLASGYKAIHIQVVLSFPLVVLMAASLFVPDTYGSFLRIIRYGGGIKAIITTTTDGSQSVAEQRGYILIQNEQVLVLLSEDRAQITEIPVSKIVRKSINVDPGWETPLYSLRQQQLLFKTDVFDRFW